MSVPGVYFLEIDGLAHDVLKRAIRDGNAPNLARWLREGSHRLMGWETDWSSQTGACQAGLLHGDNDDMPAFRWWEKDRGRAIVTNHPRDAAEIERRHSDGRGLLHEDGASRANIVSGDAVHTLLTMSTVLDRHREGRIGQDYFAYFANPYNVTRTIALVIADVVQERWFAAQQRRRDVRPRIQRDRKYALMRAWGTVIQTDLQVQAVVSDLYAGRPVGYTTFLAYDEVAHHSGVERADALSVLRKVDRRIGRIAAAARDAPRPYRFVVLSDHGQSQGETFLDRYGISLEDLVQQACAADTSRPRTRATNEALGLLQRLADRGFGRDSARRRGLERRRCGAAGRGRGAADDTGRPSRGRGRARAVGDGLGLPRARLLPARARPGDAGADRGEVARASSPRCASTPASASCSCAPSATAPSSSGRTGARPRRGPGRGRGPAGRLPAQRRPPRPAHRRLPPLPRHRGQQHLLGETDEVAAFEELVGSHGGMGGGQSWPFAMVPSEWSPPGEPVVGAEAMHRSLPGLARRPRPRRISRRAVSVSSGPL